MDMPVQDHGGRRGGAGGGAYGGPVLQEAKYLSFLLHSQSSSNLVNEFSWDFHGQKVQLGRQASRRGDEMLHK
jgi:hypothetical protein